MVNIMKRGGDRETAVVGVIEAILLIALFAIILSSFQLLYVPQLMENRESEHMDQVSNQFSQLKFAIDLQSISKTDISISTPITLGSREIPYLITARAFGSLSILRNSSTIFLHSDNQNYTFLLGDIVYNADNAYYAKQSYIFEGGAVILKQGNSTVMRISPSISSNLVGDALNITMHIINITDYAGRSSVSGYTSTFIRTNYSSHFSTNASNVSMTFYTNYPDVWYNFFNSTLDRNTVNVVKSTNYIQITPKPGYKIDISLDMVKIYAQVGLGWIGKI